MENKQGILVASFGTSYPDTCKKNIGAIENSIQEAFPNWEVRRAFTSGMIMKKLNTQNPGTVDSLSSALDRYFSDGFERVVIQPTHIIHGEEYEGIKKTVRLYQNQFLSLTIGAPLLSAPQDYQQVAAIIGGAYPPQPDTALCLMGHGSTHPADSAYAALDYHFKSIGFPHIFVGTVEGYPDLAAMMKQVQNYGAKKVMLAPFMVVAGDHAQHDMAGKDKTSWKNMFHAAGIQVQVILKGLGEYPEIRNLYVSHTRNVINSL